jgi:hypothetical protein
VGGRSRTTDGGRAFVSDVDEMPAQLNRAAKLTSLGDGPLAVVTAGTGAAASWSGEQNDLATLSSNSVHRTVAGATHHSLIDDRRDAAQSSRAIGDVVRAVQEKLGRCPCGRGIKTATGRAMSRQAAAPIASQSATRAPMMWGIVVGLLQAATPPLFWWLNSATVYALGLMVIAAVYVGFAVADGRPHVIAVESSVTFAFVILAAAAVTGSPWLLVAGMVGHAVKDLWQHRTHFVANTRWWPPFCMAVDWVVAAIIAGEIAAGMHLGLAESAGQIALRLP